MAHEMPRESSVSHGSSPRGYSLITIPPFPCEGHRWTQEATLILLCSHMLPLSGPSQKLLASYSRDLTTDRFSIHLPRLDVSSWKAGFILDVSL